MREEAWPEAASTDELHDTLMLLLVVNEREGLSNGWADHLEQLIGARRATRLHTNKALLWAAAEQLPLLLAAFPEAQLEPPIDAPPEFRAHTWTADEAETELVRGRLQGLGPITAGSPRQRHRRRPKRR